MSKWSQLKMRHPKSKCKAPVLTEAIGGWRKCKRKATHGSYCYQHAFLLTFTGFYIVHNFKDGQIV